MDWLLRDLTYAAATHVERLPLTADVSVAPQSKHAHCES
jgi:hypothetical protein